MDISMRTVIFQDRIEIGNVPIYSCDVCKRSEVLPQVKQELTDLIARLKDKLDKKHLDFDEYSELACLLARMLNDKSNEQSTEAIVEERVNELLDLLLLSQSLKDTEWTEEVRLRLTQLAKYSAITQDLS